MGSKRSRATRVALVVGAAALAAGLGAPSAGFGAGAPKCSSAQLALKFVSFQGATGGRYWELAFQNTAATCTLRGFPGVKLLDKHGHVINTPIGHWNVNPVKTVKLAMNKRAFFIFRYTDGGFCTNNFHASRFKFTPPQNHAGFVFNPVPQNHGAPFICKGSARVAAVSAKK